MTDNNPEQALQLARQRILEPAGIDERQLEAVLGSVLGHAVDSADLYFQVSRHESWSLEDSIVRDAAHSIEQGVGVRAMSGEKTGFAYSDEIVLPALTRASEAARAIARQGNQASVQAWAVPAGRSLYAPIDPLESVDDARKVKLLERVDREVRAMDPRVREVMVSMAGVHDVILVAGSDGTLAGDIRPLVRFNVSVIVEENGRREQGYAGGGGRFGYELFFEDDTVIEYAREALRQALLNLEAVDAPAGTMTVVLGPGWPGVLLHEASATASRATSTAKGRRHFPVVSASGSRRSSAPSSTTARWSDAAVR